MAGLRAPIAAPELQEPAVSLIRSSNDALRRGTDLTEGRWVNGIAYQPIDDGSAWVRDLCDGTTVETPATPNSVVEWQSYLIGVDDVCSSIGFRGHDFKGRLEAKLKVARHKQIEKEFWGGALATANTYPNLWLTKAGGATDLTPGTVPSVMRALGVLEQGIADSGLGGRGMIHVRPEAMPHLTQVRRVGNLLLTARDTIIVVGTGYLNTKKGGGAPTAGQTAMFATGLVDVRLDAGSVNYFTVDPLGRPSQSTGFSDDEIVMNMNRSNNTIVTRAEMFGLASWDGRCWLTCNAVLEA